MKKLSIITILLTVLMSMVGTKTFAHDIEVKNADGRQIYYNWINNKTELAVTWRGNYESSWTDEYLGAIVIPESVEYDGTTYRVTSISSRAFSGCTKLYSVTIGNNVTSIGDYAFSNCSGLTSITIPCSVTSIGSFAFHGCDGIIRVDIADLLKWCSFSFVGIDSNPLSKGGRLYLNKSEITDLFIPDGITSIGDLAFAGCTSLTSVTIPNSVASIGEHAFFKCTNLTSVTFSNSVTTIGDYAFQYCSSLTWLTIPNSVTYIGKRAFNDCKSLQRICSLIQNPFDLDNEDPFNNQTALTIPIGTKTAYKEKKGWKNFKNMGETEQCAKPTITYNNGKVSFSCETEDVEYRYMISNTYPKGEGSQVPFLPRVCVYATKSGYADSDVAIAEIEIPSGLKGDLNNDNKVNVADHVELSNIIMSQDNIVGE